MKGGKRGESRPVYVRFRWAILILLAVTPCQGRTPRKNDFVFFVLADPQMGMYTHNQGFARETKNLKAVIEAANRLHPAFVVVCGDLVNKPEDTSEIHGYLRVVRQLQPGIPLYNVPGNHDVGNVPTPALLAAYRKIFGRDWYSFHARDLEGIVIDSQLFSDGDKALQAAHEQETWLRATLDSAKRDHVQHIVVFQHIPWFLKRPKEKNNYFNIPQKTRLEYLKLFRVSGVHYIFAGHYHRNARGKYRSIRMITLGPVGKPLGKDPSGFTEVVVTHDGLRYTYIPISSLSKGAHGSKQAAIPSRRNE